MELNRNPENFFAEVEQSAFNPASVVPGIGFSPDKMLQGRLFTYGDAQRYRLGVNHHLIPVNAAAMPGAQLPPRRRDARRRQLTAARWATSRTAMGNGRSSPTIASRRSAWQAAQITGISARTRTTIRSPARCSGLMTADQQRVLFDNTARAIGGAPQEIQLRHIGNCLKADPAYGKGVADALGIALRDVPR